MKKMNYSNFDDGIKIIPANSVDRIDIRQDNNLLNVNRQVEKNVANAISPVTAIASIVNTLSDTASVLSKCIAMVLIEKQRTKQIEVQARLQIEESIQQTNRIRIQEKENTKRLITQCKTDLAKKKQELKMIRENNRSKEVELTQNHHLYIKQLNDLNKIVENIMNDKNIIHQLILNTIDDSQGVETLLHSLNDINTKLVEMSKEIVELKKG